VITGLLNHGIMAADVFFRRTELAAIVAPCALSTKTQWQAAGDPIDLSRRSLKKDKPVQPKSKTCGRYPGEN
jgi:hypothetical protein